MKFALVIDESGDTGLENLISWLTPGKGSHHLFIFGAYVVETENGRSVREIIEELEKKFKKTTLHFCDLDHSRRAYCAQSLATAPITAFGLISDKNQLQGYKGSAQKPQYFFNKNVQYLLETVGKWSAATGNEIEHICFEERKHDFNQLRNYLQSVRDDRWGVRSGLPPNHPYHDAEYLRGLPLDKPFYVGKKKNGIFKAADVIAGSIRAACCPDWLGISENRYLRELSPIFHKDKSGKILGNGIIPVRDLSRMQLKPQDESFFRQFGQGS